jgi:hypothetical protein
VAEEVAEEVAVAAATASLEFLEAEEAAAEAMEVAVAKAA